MLLNHNKIRMTISINSNVTELIYILLYIYIYFKRKRSSKINGYTIEIKQFIDQNFIK